MFMYKFTSCYLKTINFCKQNYPEIDKIELTFLLPSYPKIHLEIILCLKIVVYLILVHTYSIFQWN